MAPESKSEIVGILEKSRQEFQNAVAGVEESKAVLNPQPGRWSVLQCVEHVTTVEERFLSRIQQAGREGAPPLNKEKEAELLVNIPNRSNRAQAPEAALPNGRFTTLAEALAQFEVARARSIEFAEKTGADLYSISSEHPRFGPMNGTEMMLIIAGHARRHAAQIREVREVLGIL
jgi:hypothetical protein